jgi:predicted DNA-binding transcriptional regulator AlpA
MEVFDTVKAAEFLGLSPWTLRRWRRAGLGPKWRKMGPRLVRYLRSDLEAYISGILSAEVCPKCGTPGVEDVEIDGAWVCSSSACSIRRWS